MAATTSAAHKLGKRAVRVDVRTLQLARYADKAALPAPPKTFDETKGVHEWPMYANDRIGDCTIAAAAHMIEAWTASSRGQAVEITESSVLRAFDKVKIVDPKTGEEEGAVMLDVLGLWRAHGIGRHHIGAYAKVSVYDHVLMRTACWLFGGLYLGLSLPISAQNQQIWDFTGSLSGSHAPGSWGGHAVDVVRYDANTLTVVTWGALKKMTWAFADRYCDEAYCLLSKDFLKGTHAPNGFDLDALNADLALITHH
jgi:hypothetical protein